MGDQTYTAWFTTYPSTHEKAGETVEVVIREKYDALRTALVESHGSYMSLVANLEGLAKTAPNWDGPSLARQHLTPAASPSQERNAIHLDASSGEGQDRHNASSTERRNEDG